jgi:hypothetical protein
LEACSAADANGGNTLSYVKYLVFNDDLVREDRRC